MSYQTKVYRKQGGDELVVASGGKIVIESGGDIENPANAIDVTNAASGTGATGAGGTGATGAEGTGATGATAGTNVAEQRCGHVKYAAPIAAELITIKADAAVADGAIVVAAQPDFPRKLQVRITDANSSISAGTLTLVGVGPSGEAVTEEVALTGGTATKTTTYAYATVTSGTVAGLAGNEGADNLSIGVAAALGLPGCKTPASSAFAVYKADVENANEAVGTVDATAGTIVPTTAPNGARVFDFWYTYSVTPTQNTHTHTGPSHTHTGPSHTHTGPSHTHTATVS